MEVTAVKEIWLRKDGRKQVIQSGESFDAPADEAKRMIEAGHVIERNAEAEKRAAKEEAMREAEAKAAAAKAAAAEKKADTAAKK